MTQIKVMIIAFVFFAFAVQRLSAQNSNQEFDDNQKAGIIEKALELIKENYVFPHKYYKIESDIKSKLSQKDYSKYLEPQEFLDKLNKDLQVAGEDKHLKISFNPELVKQIRDEIEAEKKGEVQESPSYTPELLAWIKYENYGLRKVERMEGNIGYFKFDRFTDLRLAKERIAGAMNFINNSSAIILDLRDNGGGDGEASGFIINYFFHDNTKIGEVKFRKDKKAKEVIVKNDKDVKKFSNDILVYILVSSKTASAAENVAYVLQQFKRAVVIGEQTAGKANPGELFVINDFLYMMVPTGSGTIGPTGTNWEGTGVIPDITINQSKALLKAMYEICMQLENKDENPEHKKNYNWLSAKYQALLNPQKPGLNFLNSIVGDYEGERKIVLENQTLYYQNKFGDKKVLTYLNNQTFMLEGNDDVRLMFFDNENPVKYFEFVYSDGFVEKINRII